MPIERLETDAEDAAPEPGQEAYEALAAVAVHADEFTLMGLLTGLKRGEDWKRIPPAQRALCAALEDELFSDGDED